MKAREGLKKRGLIDYSKGEGKGKPALYTLNLSDEQPLQLPQPMTQPLTGSLACKLPQPLPHSNIKEENNQKEGKEEKHSPSSNSKVVLSLSELRGKLLNDDSWLRELSERLTKNKIILNDEDLKDKIRGFFSEQELKGCKGKEEVDCRDHVFNWINYKYKNGEKIIRQKLIKSKDGPIIEEQQAMTDIEKNELISLSRLDNVVISLSMDSYVANDNYEIFNSSYTVLVKDGSAGELTKKIERLVASKVNIAIDGKDVSPEKIKKLIF